MERDKAKQLAESVGLIFVGGDPVGDHFVDKMTQFASLVEQETLERAAKVCIDKAMKMENEASLADTEDDAISLRSSAWLISVCGNEIRNLKGNHDKE